MDEISTASSRALKSHFKTSNICEVIVQAFTLYVNVLATLSWLESNKFCLKTFHFYLQKIKYIIICILPSSKLRTLNYRNIVSKDFFLMNIFTFSLHDKILFRFLYDRENQLGMFSIDVMKYENLSSILASIKESCYFT